MNYVQGLFIALVLACTFAQNAHAGRGIDRATGQALWDAAVKGRTTTIGSGGGMKIISPAGSTTSAGGGAAKVTGNARVPVADQAVPVGFTGQVAKDAIVGGVIGCATGGYVGCALGVATPLAIAWMSLSGARVNPQTGQPELTDPGRCTQAPCFTYRGSVAVSGQYTTFFRTVDGAINAWKDLWNADIENIRNQAYDCFLRSPGDDFLCYLGPDNSNYMSIGLSKLPAEPESPTWYPATPQSLRDALYRTDPDPGIVDELSKAGNITWPLGNVQTSGPSEVKGPLETSTTRDGNRTTTTTSQQSTPINYSGPDVTAGNPTRTTTTATTTTNPDGSTSTSTSTTTSTTDHGTQPTTPDVKEEDEPPTDTALPPVPDLYIRKYPQGMEGIYDQFKDQLKNTSLGQLAKQLMPNVGDGGQCPSWPINLELADWASYGVHDVAPPCWIWGVAKAILLLSALLLARALIFGG